MNKVKPDISIIIPIYNAGKDITRCLDSIFNQQFSGRFEVIAVDDASSDNSVLLLKDYQSKEPGLKIIEHGVNKKLTIARTTGMNASVGNYIMHVDQDDWLMPDALEQLLKKCLETDADILVFNYLRENKMGEKTSVNNIKKEMITTDKLEVQHHFFGACWSKIVKRTLTEHMIYGEVGINMAEDLLYATEILLRAEKICMITEPYYVYFLNTESLTLLIKPEQLLGEMTIILKQLEKITTKYKAGSKFINNILSYLEKHIYVAISHAAFLSKSENLKNTHLINAFRLFPEMTDKRLNNLSLASTNKYYSLVQIFLKFGPKRVFGIILRNVKRRFF